jgi:hypothetical protein
MRSLLRFKGLSPGRLKAYVASIDNLITEAKERLKREFGL